VLNWLPTASKTISIVVSAPAETTTQAPSEVPNT